MMTLVRKTFAEPWRTVMAAAIVLGTSAGGLSAGEPADPRSAPDLTPVQWHPAPKHQPVTIVAQGKAVAVIAAMPPRVRKADLLIQQMQEAIEAATGARLEIVRDRIPADRPAIVVGDCEASRAAGLDAAALPIEGFVVKTAPNRVFIVGSTQELPVGHNDGVAWGVADLLERLVGVRWYWPTPHGGRWVRRSPTLAIAPAHYQDAPHFRMRTCWPPYAGGPDNRTFFHPLLACLRSASSWPHQLTVHQPNWNQVPDYVQNRPEIFQRRPDGTRNLHMLCYGNPKTLATFLENIEAYYDRGLRNDKRVTFFRGDTITVSPQDAGIACHCDHCKALMRPEAGQWGSASQLVGQFVRKLAEQVKQRWPDKTILYLPYLNYTLAPEGIEFPDNVEVQLCGMPGVAMYKEPALAAQFQANIDRWAELTGRRVQTWDYSCWPAESTRAWYQYSHVLADYYRRNRDKLVGSFINGSGPEWWRHHISMYVWLKLLWNPNVDVDAILAGYVERMYGPAAGPMRELLALQHDSWEKSRWPDARMTPGNVYGISFPAERVERMKDLFEQARRAAAGNEEVARRLAYQDDVLDEFLDEAKLVLEGVGNRPLVARKVADKPTIDGKLDDAYWQQAEPVTFYRQQQGKEAEARFRTELRAIWTLEGIAFGFHMQEPDPKALHRDIKTHDDSMAWHNDNVEIFLDVSGRNSGDFYQLIINPNRAVWSAWRNDVKWEPKGMEVGVHLGEDFWNVEVYLPYRMFDKPKRPGTGVKWVGQFTRHRISNGRFGKGNPPKEYSRLNFKFGGASRNFADFAPIQFVE